MNQSLPRWVAQRIEMLQHEIQFRQAEIDRLTADPDLQPDHCCGASGFNPYEGDSCPACEWRREKRGLR